ncbi:MAG TPA: phytanoyl-CoA dioxygenase family protein [Flavisolibacter sp.]
MQTAMNDTAGMVQDRQAPQDDGRLEGLIDGATSAYDIAAIMGGLYGDGIIGFKGAFSREWVQQLHEDVLALYEDALKRPGGAVGRGPKRHYVEIHPEGIRGFLDLVTHPWVTTVCEAVLGPEYKIVEIGFDVPNPGAMDQPWHRDFPAPDETMTGRHLNSLAFNLTTVDVHEDMGPFEIAPGTQWDLPTGFEHGMFPPKSSYPRYVERAQKKMPQMGDISARSALTIHRGTANRSSKARPALVLGVDAPGAINAERHDLQFTKGYYEKLPESVRRHLTCRVVDKLEPIVQAHTIEGLMMGEA